MDRYRHNVCRQSNHSLTDLFLISRFSFTRNIGVRIAGMSTQEAPKSSESRQCPTNSVTTLISLAQLTSALNQPLHLCTKMKRNHPQLKLNQKRTMQASFIKTSEVDDKSLLNGNIYWCKNVGFQLNRKISNSFGFTSPETTTLFSFFKRT